MDVAKSGGERERERQAGKRTVGVMVSFLRLVVVLFLSSSNQLRLHW